MGDIYDDQLLNFGQAAGELGVSRRTVERWRDAGQLTVVKLGRAVRVRRADLRDFIKARINRRDSVELVNW